MNYSEQVIASAEKIFNYLYIKDNPVKSDAVLGFGHFDLKIPRRCAELYLRGLAKKIIFTGGVGAGSADFKYPEAIEFFRVVRKEFPEIPREDIITEPNSTNTGENLLFTQEVLQKLDPGFTFLSGIKIVLKVSNAYRQRRAYLTCKKLFPGVTFINTPASTTFKEEFELYKTKNQDLIRHLSGEVERMIVYPSKGFIVPEEVPAEILQAFEMIRIYALKYN